VCNPEGVKLLEAEPVAAPEVAPAAPRESAPEQPPSQPEAVPTCSACGAPMQDGQDWCLTCGIAAPGRLGQRPGWRAASTVIALTVVLVLGAIAASYAALTGDSKKAPAPAAPAQAQVATPPAAQPPAATTPAPQQTTTTPTTPHKQPTTKIPKVKTPTSTTSGGSPLKPTPSTSTPKGTTGAPPVTGTTSTPSTTTNGQGAKPAVGTAPTPIELAGDAGKLYDPYGRATVSGQGERALDGDAATSWYVDAKDPQQFGLGYAVDLGKLQGIREIELQTPTPGFRIEVYATDEATPPPDILDTRWSHITNVSKVGVKDNGKQKIVLGAGTTKYRNLLLWFTQPPTDGARLRLTELQLLG
jgi:hypothetical protein